MYRRPLAVTFVGSILCILGLLSVLDVLGLVFRKGSPFMLMGEDAPLSVVVPFGIIAVNAAITLVCGVFVLKGANWARWLYPICFVGVIVFLQITSHDKFNMVLTMMMQGALILFLFLPRANAYFSSPQNPK
jgi:hypothetical protein